MTDYENNCPHLFQYVSTFGWEDAIALCDRLVFDIESAAAACRRHDGDNYSGGDAEDDESSSHDDEDDDYYDCYDCGGGGGGDDDCRRRRRRNRASSLRGGLRLAREQLYHRDQWGNTPLHAALYVKPPIEVVAGLFRVGRALLTHGGGGGVIGTEECGDCGHRPPIWATTSGDGSTPFLGE
jgi:hypothetical protein